MRERVVLINKRVVLTEKVLIKVVMRERLSVRSTVTMNGRKSGNLFNSTTIYCS